MIPSNPQETFNTQHARLNVAQKEAVDTIEGPVIVIAGPGTGKTTILTLRIANILKTSDTEPEQILALTFTESGVMAMRRKLLEVIGQDAYRVKIFTFHGFCNSVIEEFPQYFPRIIGGAPAGDIDQIKIIQELLEEHQWDKLTPYGNPVFYVHKIKSHISDLKREGITAELFEDFIRKEKDRLENADDAIHLKGAHKGKVKAPHLKALERIVRDQEFARMFTLYEESLTERNLFDFDDSIGEVVKALTENDDLKQVLQEEHQYLLADEHQDTNSAQNSILELLADFHDSPNIFIVGDEKQAIFRFQGASLSNFLYFGEKYPTTKRIRLDQNYRSTQPILDASFRMISENETPEDLKVDLKANRDHLAPHIDLFEATTEDQEISHLVTCIKKEIETGKDPKSIACIVRHNKDISLLARYFEMAEIPVVMHSNKNLLLEPFTLHILQSLRAFADLTDSVSLIESLFAPFWPIDYLEIHTLSQTVYRNREQSAFELLRESGKYTELASKLQDLSEKSLQMPILDFLEEFWYESESLSVALKNGADSEEYEIIQALYQEARKLTETHPETRLREFVQHLTSLQGYGNLTGSKVRSGEGVQLMTAHRSKGLEFDTVFVPFLHDKKWSGRKSTSYFSSPVVGFESDISDERRLLYVALTRAEQNLTLSYHTQNPEGKELLPSRFLSELDQDIIEHRTCETDTVLIIPVKQLQEKTPELESLLKVTRDYILNKSLSITALNKFMDDPWHFFFVTILRVPQTLSLPQVYGTAVHDVLHHYQTEFTNGKTLTQDEALDYFMAEVTKSSLTESHKKTLLEKGQRNLPGYVTSHVWKPDTRTEKKFRADLTVDLDGEREVGFTGIIDAIEMNTPNAGDSTVIDYKTGKPKSRNALLGKTQTENGDYYKQIIFYAWLLQKNRQDAPKQGIIEFVEATDKGEYKKEIFEISQEEIDTLEKALLETIQQIYSGEFLKSPPEPEHNYYSLWSALMDTK